MEHSRHSTLAHGLTSPQVGHRPGIPLFLFALLNIQETSGATPFLKSPLAGLAPFLFISPTTVDGSSVPLSCVWKH